MIEYNRQAAVDYAARWAFARNPLFTDFEDLGGDCTNFVSQCIYAGGAPMNYTPVFGWYFISLDDRSASWTGVPFLYDFLTSNDGVGPYGSVLPLNRAMLGDVIQIRADDEKFTHTMIVTALKSPSPTPSEILIAAHSYDSFNRPLSTYDYIEARLIHIEGINEP